MSESKPFMHHEVWLAVGVLLFFLHGMPNTKSWKIRNWFLVVILGIGMSVLPQQNQL